MTYLETYALVPGDRVTCGQREGRVTHVRKYTIAIDWQVGGDPYIYDRTDMDAFCRLPPRKEQP